MIKVIAGIASVLVVLIGLGYLSIVGTGKAMSTDLSIIGKGRPALVLVYENYSPAAGDALNRLGKVMPDYASRLDFVVADLGVPEGRAFADRHRLVNGQAMFLTADGTPLRASNIAADEQELRNRLEAKLAMIR